jgi:hypothetical protein
MEGGDPSMKLVPAGGPRLTPGVDLALLVGAIVLMVVGAVLTLIEVLDPAIAIPVIAVGIALVAIGQVDKRRHEA